MARRMLPPAQSPPGQNREIRRDGVFFGRKVGKAPALLSEARPIARVVDVRQPWDDRSQSGLPLSGTVTGNTVAVGCAGVHALHVTRRRADFQPRFPHCPLTLTDARTSAMIL